MKTWLMILACLLAPTAHGAELDARSGELRVSVVELFTSEGCSSCPPAEAWMNRLRDDPRLWTELVPLAFHVDYWDAIGWHDRFATPAHSERQREYARQGRISSVYTPGLVRDGREWRGWFRRPVLDTGQREAAGTLAIRVSGGRIDGRYRPRSSPASPVLNVVVLGFDLDTQVKAGENKGRTLQHDFVVLAWRQVRMRHVGDELVAEGPLPEARLSTPRTAVAAWVSTLDDQTPLQAVGGWLQR